MAVPSTCAERHQTWQLPATRAGGKGRLNRREQREQRRKQKLSARCSQLLQLDPSPLCFLCSLLFKKALQEVLAIWGQPVSRRGQETCAERVTGPGGALDLAQAECQS